MYKKITHNIVEEHFDSAEANMFRMNSGHVRFGQPAAPQSEELTKLNMDSREYFSDIFAGDVLQ
jgi:hypothetical protein